MEAQYPASNMSGTQEPHISSSHRRRTDDIYRLRYSPSPRNSIMRENSGREGPQERTGTITMLKAVYIVFAFAASICFVWLSYTGPPPPLAEHADVYLPRLESSPTFLLGNAAYRPFDDATDRLWDALIPANKGAVLATNITSGFHVWATPAMFHQLKCLRDIRKYFIALDRSWEEAQRFMSQRGPGSAYENVAYCFDYVRQVC
jgi:hypothetical protein